MDVDVTFELFMEALTSGNKDEASEAFFALNDWLNKGGFVPSVSAKDLQKLMLYALSAVK